MSPGSSPSVASSLSSSPRSYTTSVGWLGYDDDKVRRLTKESLEQGFNRECRVLFVFFSLLSALLI